MQKLKRLFCRRGAGGVRQQMRGQTAMDHITTNMSNIYYLSICFKSLQFTYQLLFIDLAKKQIRQRSRQRIIRHIYNCTVVIVRYRFGYKTLQVPLQVWYQNGTYSPPSSTLWECVHGHQFVCRRGPPSCCPRCLTQNVRLVEFEFC